MHRLKTVPDPVGMPSNFSIEANLACAALRSPSSNFSSNTFNRSARARPTDLASNRQDPYTHGSRARFRVSGTLERLTQFAGKPVRVLGVFRA